MTKLTEIKRNVREYCEQFVYWQLNNLGEIDKILQTEPTLTQEEMENLNTAITRKEMELVIKNISTNKGPGPDGSTTEFYHTFKELTLIILQFFKN